MSLKRIAASAASIIVLFGMCSFARYDSGEKLVPVTAFADEYDYNDDIDIDEIELDDIDIDEIDVNADISEDGSRSGKREHSVVVSFFVSLIIGLVSALIAVSMMKSSMKSVRKKSGAADYRKENSFKLEKNTDTFMYKRVEKTAIPKTNQTNKQ